MIWKDDPLRLQGVKESWVGALDQELSKQPTYQHNWCVNGVD